MKLSHYLLRFMPPQSQPQFLILVQLLFLILIHIHRLSLLKSSIAFRGWFLQLTTVESYTLLDNPLERFLAFYFFPTYRRLMKAPICPFVGVLIYKFDREISFLSDSLDVSDLLVLHLQFSVFLQRSFVFWGFVVGLSQRPLLFLIEAVALTLVLVCELGGVFELVCVNVNPWLPLVEVHLLNVVVQERLGEIVRFGVPVSH